MYREANKKALSAQRKVHYQENKEEIRAKGKADRIAHPRKRMIASAKARAKKKGVPYTLEPTDDFEIPERCPILNIELKRSDTGRPGDTSPSLDCIVPELGYIADNVRVISHRANTIKYNATAAEHRAIADWIDREYPHDLEWLI